MCNPQDKAKILSELTGKSTNEIIEERINENKTYGIIALENRCFRRIPREEHRTNEN